MSWFLRLSWLKMDSEADSGHQSPPPPRLRGSSWRAQSPVGDKAWITHHADKFLGRSIQKNFHTTNGGVQNQADSLPPAVVDNRTWARNWGEGEGRDAGLLCQYPHMVASHPHTRPGIGSAGAGIGIGGPAGAMASNWSTNSRHGAAVRATANNRATAFSDSPTTLWTRSAALAESTLRLTASRCRRRPPLHAGKPDPAPICPTILGLWHRPRECKPYGWRLIENTQKKIQVENCD